MSRTTLRRLEVFVAVVDAGGFRACLDRLDISPAAVLDGTTAALTRRLDRSALPAA